MEEICAIIVSHNPDVEVLNRLLQSLTEQVSHIVIVDNCSSNDIVQWIEAITIPSLVTIYVEDNKGLGYAYNIGMQKAKYFNCAYVIFFDQDSIPSANMVLKLMDAHNKLFREDLKIAAVGPVFRDSRSGAVSPFFQFDWFRFRQLFGKNGDIIPADFLISSGSLYSMDALAAVGNMDADLFIDKVDTEWFLRARAMGYRAWGVCDAVMEHSVGEETRSVWFLRNRLVNIHAPFRYYYRYRNSVLLYRRPYITLQWITADLLFLIKLTLYILLFGPGRTERFGMMLKGLYDGIRGVHGKLP